MAESRAGGLGRRLAGGVDSVLATLQTRLSLLTVEVEEEGIRLGAALFNLILAALFAGFGILSLAMFFTVWLWDSHRLLALGLDCALFIGLTVWTARNAARRLGAGSRLFKDSVAELQRDRAALEPEE